ncbi:FAD-dependent monooxygenase [Nannocystis sp. ILAH1]|uniref:FAD-dependent monooxygenase n=1 Tax=Nannocystis sp. ILAH1 TaxID=2996789 RepID=UPI0023EF41BC|nr:FAD-dependent monooxygenase [Nannocystis sp. ILAH1]
MEFDGAAFDRSRPITREHLEEVLRRISGVDVRIEELQVASTFTDRAMQATTYRRGRVLLAGDSAHVHSPMGGQGLNVGIGDAINLGWKLAGVVRGSAPAGLLDSYTLERHPIGVAMLEWSRAQVVTLQPNLHGAAIGRLVEELLRTDEGTNAVVARLWGVSQRYELGEAHPLVGMSAPDLELADGNRLGVRLQGGRGLLIDLVGEAGVAALGRGWASRIEYVCLGARDTLGLRALLVRPDGIVAWVAEGAPDLDAAAVALGRWFGARTSGPR